MDAEDNLDNLRVASFSYYLKPGEEKFVQKISSPQTDDHELSFPITTKPSIIKPSPNFNFPHPVNGQDTLSNSMINHNIFAASFSTQLNDAKENIMFRVKAPIQDLNAGLLSPRICSTHVERTNSSNGEIGVFGADKYFNTRLVYNTTAKIDEKESEVLGLESNLKLKNPSISSEASSWSSQAALLRNLSQKTSQTRPRRLMRRRIFSSFGCSGPCFDKGSVCVAQNNGSMPNGGSKKSTDHFTFPVLKNPDASTQDMPIKKAVALEDPDPQKVEEARRSLEVFGSGRMKNGGDIATNLARKLSMLTWDAIPKSSSTNNNNNPTMSVGSTTICDDMTSDASSDLFEIEEISGTGYSLLMTSVDEAVRNDEDDEYAGSCMSPPIQEAPSEASIEWSVVTASAADFSSVVSDYDEKSVVGVPGGIIRTGSGRGNSRNKNLVGKEAQKGRPGGLLGCKSEKAVNVAQTVVHKTRVVERY